MNEYAEYFSLIRANDFEGAKAYLAVNPAAANARDNTGVPAVLRAMQTGDDDFCRWIIEQSLSKLNETDPDGATALHYAAAKGSPELLRYLVERVGWDPLRGDCKGRTPYGIAHMAGNAAGEAYFAEAVGAAWDDLYANPVLPGFRPDPSIVRVGEDYYMVNSSFTWFPAIPISHSRDLVHWEPVGHVLTDPENAMLQGLEGGHGYWAPDISYYSGRFYVTATLRRNDDHPRPRAQIVTSAPAPEGPWDPPAVIEENGIDPSLFTDGDGKRYMVLNRGARLLPLTPDARAATGPARLLWYGDIKRASEGPHILQKDGWYYIILAEGGTGMTHQISVGRWTAPTSRAPTTRFCTSTTPMLLCKNPATATWWRHKTDSGTRFTSAPARRTVSARWAARPRWTPWSGPPTAGPSSTAARGRPRCSAAPTCRGSCPTPPALTPPMRAAFGSARACPPMPHGTAAR